MKLLLDFFPIILFFAAYQWGDIYLATGVAIIATMLQLIYARLVLRKVDAMMWLSAAIVVVFGGLTLVLHDPTFIKWKPTVLYWAMAISLAVGVMGFRRNLIRALLEAQVQHLPDVAWARLNYAWIIFLLCMGALNLAIAYSFSEAIWVNFKLFGGMGLMFVFVIGQALYLAKYIKQDEN